MTDSIFTSPTHEAVCAQVYEATRGRGLGLTMDETAAIATAALKATQQEMVRNLRSALEAVRDDICRGPVDDTLWRKGGVSQTTVDFITRELDDDFDYDKWLEENVPVSIAGFRPKTQEQSSYERGVREATAIAGNYCWNRQVEGRYLHSAAVFTSHTHQSIREAILASLNVTPVPVDPYETGDL